jgi:hypothetical protein
VIERTCRPRKWATKAMCDPTVTGGAIFQSTTLMLMYQSGALSRFAE